jgi:hypothetical protein
MTDPLTLLVVSYVLPAAATTYAVWLVCANVSGRLRPQRVRSQRR